MGAKGRLALIVINCTMGLGAGVCSCSWEAELLGESGAGAGAWLQVWCHIELKRSSGTLLAVVGFLDLPQEPV